ncbi:MAG: PD-(D/E)XK nuclease family protein [Clostridia bacterium]|nr:PD-(D/E)XK nuclease family protein [Clostridia bacterium]
MLGFLMGTDPAAKREYIADRLREAALSGGKAVLIVPEQEDFDRNKEMLELCGERICNSIIITSFSRFSRQLLEKLGLPVKPQADDSAVNVLMSLAVKQLSDELGVYSQHASRPGRVASLVSFYNELSNAGKTPEELKNAGERAGGRLREKTRELSLIFTVFEGLLSQRFSTAAGSINVAAAELSSDDGLSETDFYFDDFRGFTCVQIRFISSLMSVCKNCFVSIAGYTPGSGKLYFEHALKNRRRLDFEAKKRGVEVFQLEIDAKEGPEGLGLMRENLFSDEGVCFGGAGNDITVVRAQNRYDECEFIALTAKKLLDSGFCRARDIAALHRSPEMTAPLVSALRKYGVPVFRDERRPLAAYPLVRLMLCAVETAAKGFSTQRILSLVKTDVAGISLLEYSELENYVYRWQLDGRAWESDFTRNPDGFGEEETEDSARRLSEINAVRRRITEPLVKLRSALKQNDAEKSCRAVYFYLKDVHADESFRAFAVSLFENGDEAGASECKSVWDLCMQNLDSLRGALGENPVAPTFFHELLCLIFSGGSVGRIPPGIDKMTVGIVDRTRVLKPGVVFIPGFCEGVFPKNTASPGLLSSKELRALDENDLSLERLPEEVYEEERLILYNTLTLAGKRLFISYPAVGTSGEQCEPSPVIEEIRKLFPDDPVLSTSDIPREDRITTPQTALSQLALSLGEDSSFRASLEAALLSVPGQADKVSALRRAVNGPDADFTDPAAAKRLFGENIPMSASKAETYSKCPFMYFCRYGMGVEKLTRSKIDSRINGLIIHKVLEDLISAHLRDGIENLSDEEMAAEINRAVDEYCASCLGGAENLTGSLGRTVEKLKKEIFDMLSVRRREFSVCMFKTAAAELSIGYADGIKGYEVPLPDGGRLIIKGSVDRVDIMKNGEASYVRVIDYKTGGKDFRLSDVFCGLNMQMLIYLFAVCENGKERFGELLPAGVLYVPAKGSGKTLDRNAGPEEILRRRIENGRMNGVILENAEVIKGMEAGARGLFINAQIQNDGSLKGNLLSFDDFICLHKKIDSVLTEMGMSIQAGAVPAVPVDEGNERSVCSWCDYSAVCLKEDDCEKRTVEKTSHEEAVKKLREEAAT